MNFKTFVLKMAQTKAGIWPPLSHACPIRSIADRQCVVRYVEGPTRHGLMAEHRHPVRHDVAAALDGERERDSKPASCDQGIVHRRGTPSSLLFGDVCDYIRQAAILHFAHSGKRCSQTRELTVGLATSNSKPVGEHRNLQACSDATVQSSESDQIGPSYVLALDDIQRLVVQMKAIGTGGLVLQACAPATVQSSESDQIDFSSPRLVLELADIRRLVVQMKAIETDEGRYEAT